MENKKPAKEELKIKLEESFQESMKQQEIDGVIEVILNVLDDCNLSPIEILGILEVIRHHLHEEIQLQEE